MAYTIVSACCQSRFTEEATESNNVDHVNVCATCGLPCKLTRIGEPDGKPRSQEQAYRDAFDAEGKLKPVNDPEIFQKEKVSSGVEIRDGKIFQDGVQIGVAIDDKEWFKQSFGEEWKGSDEALKMLRSKS